MKLTKSQLKRIIKEELNEAGYYDLGAELFKGKKVPLPDPAAERLRLKIEAYRPKIQALFDLPVPTDSREKQHMMEGIKLSVSEILSNIEDDDVRDGVKGIVSDLLGTMYLPLQQRKK